MQKSWRRYRGSLRMKVSSHVGDTDAMVGWHLLFAIRRATARGKYGRELKAASWLLYTNGTGGISFAVGSSGIAAERKGQGWNSPIDQGGEPSGLDSGLIFTPISTLTVGVATS